MEYTSLEPQLGPCGGKVWGVVSNAQRVVLTRGRGPSGLDTVKQKVSFPAVLSEDVFYSSTCSRVSEDMGSQDSDLTVSKGCG